MLRDPEIPSLGNPKGDLTVVEYFDYQCPYCKKMAPELAQLVREDGNIRLVLKDWPIFGAISTAAAEIALAAKYQNKYAEAHDALIGADTKLTKASIADLLAKAGVDVDLAIKDLQAHQKTIDDLLARNEAQADAFGFQGTPGFIVGTFRVPGVVEMKVFKASWPMPGRRRRSGKLKTAQDYTPAAPPSARGSWAPSQAAVRMQHRRRRHGP